MKYIENIYRIAQVFRLWVMIVTLHSHLDLLVAVVILISLIIRCKPCNYLMPMEDKVSLRVLQHNKSIIKQLNLIANLFHKQRPKRIRISRTIIFQYLLLFDNNFFYFKNENISKQSKAQIIQNYFYLYVTY